MVGQGVLRECLLDPEAESVLIIGRSATGQQHEKLHEIISAIFLISLELRIGFRATTHAFFCLGVSAAGMKEEAYRRVTYDLTISVAGTSPANPGMTFIRVGCEYR